MNYYNSNYPVRDSSSGNFNTALKRKKKRRILHRIGLVLSALMFIAMIVLDVHMFMINILPTKILFPAIIIMLIIWIVTSAFLLSPRKKTRYWIGLVINVLLTVIMIAGIYYISKTYGLLKNITNIDSGTSQIGIYVATDDSAQALSEMKDYTFGILSFIDRENADAAIANINKTLDTEVKTADYSEFTKIIDDLLNHNINAIILNIEFIDTIKDIEGYEDVESKIREITQIEIKNNIKTEPGKTAEEVYGDGIFTVYLSGVDTRADKIPQRSRSDVNILAVINTNTKQVLLLSTPRDYYVPLSISNGVCDKLTHAGNFGVDVCMDTLGMLYDTEIDYYFRVNFSGFEKIIDSLGGVDVYSDYDFNSSLAPKAVGKAYHYNKGINHLGGEAALFFSRERYSFAEGDRQRGKNQMAVIKAVANKAMSPDILTKYSSLLGAMSGSFETSVPYDLITSLVRNQLNSGGDWNIVNYSVNGYGDSRITYSISTMNVYVMIPDQSTVNTAKELIRQVVNGETVSVPQ